MATTKIFSITTTESKALAYIASPSKTDNRRLIATHYCSGDPYQASREFEDIRTERGTGRNKVLSQHLIQSFAPGEITSEQALEVGKELADKLLLENFQYFLAVHTDKDHIHIHCIFNNVSLNDGRTFETLANQGNVKERAWKKLIDLSDEICWGHGLSVIEDHENTKGVSHYEWTMQQLNLSWKAKLKYAIDQVVKESENFDDFLEKCKAHGILVEYNPDHKIDLKFMLAEQKERNPRAKFTRSRTLGWYYETEQIKSRIAQYQGAMVYVPRTKIREIAPKAEENKFVRDAIDRGNMKVASIAKNIIAEYGVEPDEIRNAAISAYAKSRHLVSELNKLKTEIEDLEVKLNVLKKYRKLKHYGEELKALSGRAEKKYKETHSYELSEYVKVRTQVLELYPSGDIPTVEKLEKSITALRDKLTAMNSEYNQADKKARELAEAQRTIEDYLRQEQSRDQQKRKKRNDLE